MTATSARFKMAGGLAFNKTYEREENRPLMFLSKYTNHQGHAKQSHSLASWLAMALYPALLIVIRCFKRVLPFN